MVDQEKWTAGGQTLTSDPSRLDDASRTLGNLGRALSTSVAPSARNALGDAAGAAHDPSIAGALHGLQSVARAYAGAVGTEANLLSTLASSVASDIRNATGAS